MFALVAIVFAILATAELATQRTADDARAHNALQAEAAAVGFAIALTTYDYAHPDVQSRALSAYATPDVVAVVKRADADLVTARASSIGSVSADWVVPSDGHEAEVVVTTSQVARFRYAPDSQRLAGRIDIQLGRSGTSWVVTSYVWLAAPAPQRTLQLAALNNLDCVTGSSGPIWSGAFFNRLSTLCQHFGPNVHLGTTCASLPTDVGKPAGKLRVVSAPQDPTSLEICAGAGGQALGLEIAGFSHVGLVEIDPNACATLRSNRRAWAVIERDVREVDGRHYRGVDLLAGGVPCPPFSFAGKQLGPSDERDLFPEALRLVEEAKPAAVMLENVRGFASDRFISYRRDLLERLEHLGYRPDWRVIEASRFGVPQLRPRFILVALRPKAFERFRWPEATCDPPTVGKVLGEIMASRSWPGASAWTDRANDIAPTIVGGSRKHGGPDLGPTRARRQWARLGVDGLGIANEPPGPEFPVDGSPKLTTEMVSRLQGFPDDWKFSGRKTAAYRQVGNAFPPPVAAAVGSAIYAALTGNISRVTERAIELTA